jgi:hypothetical protein
MHTREKPVVPGTAATMKNLVLVNHPGWQEVIDFLEIKARIEQKAADIGVFVVSNSEKNEDLELQASRNPTLVVCPSWLGKFSPRRGIVHHGARISKNEQLERLAQLSIPVPRWSLADPDLKPDPEEWGPFLVIKTMPVRPRSMPSSVGWTKDLNPARRSLVICTGLSARRSWSHAASYISAARRLKALNRVFRC